MRTNLLQSARARFTTTAAVIFALVALGGVTAMPAQADVSVYVIVTDAQSGNALAYTDLQFGPTGNAFPVTTDVSGGFGWGGVGWADGSYSLVNPDPSIYVDPAPLILDASTSQARIALQRYKVTGSIAADAGSGLTTVSIQQGVAPFAALASATVTSASGDFEFALPSGPGDYRLVFSPSSSTDYLETVSSSFTVGGSVAIFDLGAIDLNDNPVITGTVTNAADAQPLDGAIVHTLVGGVELPTVTTDINGFYRVQPGVGDETYSVWVEATDYYDSAAQAVDLNSTDGYARNNVDFALDSALVDVTGTVVSDLNPYSVTSTLYKRDSGSGLFEPTPVGTVVDSSSFAFSALNEGDYRLAFTDTVTGVTLSHAPLFVNGPPENPCYIEFQVDYAVGDLDFSDVAVDADTTAEVCGNPVWAEATDRAITGHVDNYYNFGSQLIAQLWVGGTSTPTLAGVTAVASGDYEFTGIRGPGTYFIKFIPSGGDTFLPTLLGAGGAQEWSDYSNSDSVFSTTNSFSVDPATPSSYTDHDVTIENGVMLSGWLTGGSGYPVDGCVEVIDLDDPSFSVCAQPDATNRWAIRVPVGHSYKFHAVDNVGEYTEEWWQYADNALDATEAEALYGGQYVTVDFSLAPAPASLYGFVRDVSDTDPITVFLYVYANGEFTEVASHSTAAGSDEVYFDENYFNGYDGLAVGDYRVRFQDSNGMWLSALSYETGRLPERDGTVVTNSSCFVDINDIAQGRPFYVDATFDAANQDPAACGPEPLDHRKVSGVVLSTPTWNSVPVVGHTVALYSDDADAYPVYATTDVDGSFTATYVPTGTFDIEVFPTTHVLGEHEFTYSGSGFVFDAGNVVLDDPLEATRLGNVTGSIANWDETTMHGATVTVYRLVTDPDGDYWKPGTVAQTVDGPTGTFEVPGVDVDGDYAVRVDFPADYAPSFLGGGYPTPASSTPGFAEQDLYLGSLPVNLDELVTISGNVSFGANPVEYAVVVAHPIGDVCSCEAFGGPTDADGNYSFEVAPNTDYEIGALSPFQSLLNQTYDGHNYPHDETGPMAFDPYGVGSSDLAGPNFSLVASNDVYLDLSTYTSDDYDYMAGVDIHIYKAVGDGWSEIAVVTSDADAWAYLEDQDGGDYRFRFSYGGDWLAVNEVYGETSYPFEDDVDLSQVFGAPQCAVDVSDVEPGTYVYTEFYLIEDASVGDCGPETLLNRDVIGSTVQTANAGGAAIAGQTVKLTSTSTSPSTVYTTTTDARGNFEFEDVVSGNYVFSTLSTLTTNGSIYGAFSLPVTVDDNEDLGAIELTRYGNVKVQISNYDATSMNGTTAQAYLQVTDGTGTHWQAVGLVATADSTGAVSIPGVLVDGVYTVKLNYPAGFVDGYLAGYDEGVVLTATGYAEYDLTGLDTLAYTTISGTVRLGATWVTGASILAENGGGDDFTATTDINGSFTVAVPADDVYSIETTKTGLLRGLVTNQNVSFAPVTGVQLDMLYAFLEFDMYTVASGVTNVTSGVTAHLYRQVSGGWQEVQTDTASTVYFWTTLSGSYRLRFSDGADWLAVSTFGWQNQNGADSAPFTSPDPDVCFIDIAPVQAGGQYWGQVVTDPASSVECAAEPAVVAPPATPGTTGSGTKKPVAGTTPVETSEGVELAPTSTPTPVPSESAPAAPGDSDDPDCCAPASGPDLTWLFVMAGALVLLVLAGGAVYLVRRRP